jgi:ferrous iron transport protein A
MFLTDITDQQKAKILAIHGTSDIKMRLIDMGVVKGAVLEVVRKAPLGDPIEIKIKNFYLSLRKSEAQNIEVEVLV